MDISTSRYNDSDTRESLWDEDYEKAYPTIMNDTVILYAEKVRLYRCLPNFQPLRYMDSEEYRKIMDEHAQELLEAIEEAYKPLPFSQRREAIIRYQRLKNKLWGEVFKPSDDDDEPTRVRAKDTIEEDKEI